MIHSSPLAGLVISNLAPFATPQEKKDPIKNRLSRILRPGNQRRAEFCVMLIRKKNCRHIPQSLYHITTFIFYAHNTGQIGKDGVFWGVGQLFPRCLCQEISHSLELTGNPVSVPSNEQDIGYSKSSSFLMDSISFWFIFLSASINSHNCIK